MQSGIAPLPTEVVHLIAAGEVIDSLAAAVRELVENALDAGATRLVICVWPDYWRLRVTDNGNGMTLEDLQRAATPHSTSKIRNCQDLTHIQSLGFRGEALHSLAQLSRLEILSRSQQTEAGWRIEYTLQGQPLQIEPAALAPGTVVTVDQLFGNWPARRQALPAPAQQLRALQTTIQQIALCHPSVTWQVVLNDREWFTLSPGETTRQILPQMLREVHETDLQEYTANPIHPSDPALPASLYLLLGLPDRCHRRRPNWVHIALNGRRVHLPELEQTLLSSLRRTLPRDRFPVCFLHLHLPPGAVDWNRHPAKTEVYLHHLDYWREQVAQAIEQTLQFNAATLPETYHSQQLSTLVKTAEAEHRYGFSQDYRSPLNSEDLALPNPAVNLQAIAQVHHTYILAEHPAGIWLVEQHIAHERVIYEQLCDRWQLVTLLSPIILNNLTSPQVEQLQRIGIDIAPFGVQTWMIRTAPEPLAQRADCSDALLELSQGGNLQTAQVATACRSAVRNGTPLSLQEMQTLLNQWQRTRNPRTCPHGRPIYLSLEESALSRFFRRHWVIGKSHGI